MGKRIGTGLAMLLLAGATMFGGGCRGVIVVHDNHGRHHGNHMVVRNAPPAPRVEIKSRCPSKRHVWVPGRWVWHGNHWDWKPGRWERAPRHGQVWHSGRWVPTPGGWKYQPGHWH